MEFDWTNSPVDPDSSLTQREVEESFEDPFALRLLPDSPRFAAQARFFNLGMSAGGVGIFSVYRTNGKQVRVLLARPFEPEERFFYQRKVDQTLNQWLGMRAFANWEEVPLFNSDDGEAAFWAENRPDLRLMESALAGNTGDSAESVTITLRIDPRMLARIKRLARSRYLNYQSMIKQWLSERMEQELRER